MPIVPANSYLWETTTTVQDIMDATAQDVRQTLSSQTNPSNNILMDYVNRTSLEILRFSRWRFTLSPINSIVTQLGVSNYWLGAVGQAPPGCFDTELGLTDLKFVKPGTVYDRSNFRALQKVDEAPLNPKLQLADGTGRLGRPAQWRQSPDTPYIMNIYPPADNENTFQPYPEAPTFGDFPAGGSLVNRVYYVRVSYTDSMGNESIASNETKIFIPAGQLLVVRAPIDPTALGATGIAYNRYNVYASVTANSEVKQAGPLSNAGDWTEPATGLISGLPYPVTNNVEAVDGYLIQFRYHRITSQLNTFTQIIQVPDDYKDVVIAGVNFRTFQYLGREIEMKAWQMLYMDGIRQIVRDINQFPRGSDFITPDRASIGLKLPAVESIDLSIMQN